MPDDAMMQPRLHMATQTITEHTETAAQDGPLRPFSLGDLVRYFLSLGTFGFGGPIATVGYMQRDLVDKRRWYSESDLLDGIALGQTTPGPLAAQVVMWTGFLKRGVLGAFLTAAAFILPSFVAVLVIAVLYVEFEGLALVRALFYGIAPGVMAIIATAAFRLGRTTNRAEVRLWAISALVFAVTVLTESEIAYLFILSGLAMIAIEAPPRIFKRAAAGFAGVASLPTLIAGGAGLGTTVSLALYFLKAGALIFGSGLAIVPFLREGVVEDNGWLTESEFLDAVAIGLITPGPVVITATFIGYLVAGFVGAAVATVAIFIPIYLGVVVPGPWFLRHRQNPQLRAFVRGASAAAAGAIGGVTVILTKQAVVDLPAALIALACAAAIWRFRAKEPLVVAFAGAAGVILY